MTVWNIVIAIPNHLALKMVNIIQMKRVKSMFSKFDMNSLCIIQGSNRDNNATNVVHDDSVHESHDNDDNHLGKNASALTEDASNLVDPKVAANENQTEKQQEGQKWYEGKPIRPVAFRRKSNQS